MARRKAKSRRGGGNDMVGYTIFGVIAIAATIAIFAMIRLDRSTVRTTADTNCPNGGPYSVTVLLADVTDPLSVAQTQDFRNQYDALIEKIPQYGSIEIFVVRDSTTALIEPVLSLCNPGRGTNVSELTGNPAKLERKWEQEFKAPIEEAFDKITEHTDAPLSPILESIQSVSLTSLLPPERALVPRRLVVFSDLMQNTADMNFYRHLPTIDELSDSNSFNRTRTDLRGVDVELWHLYRPEVMAGMPRDHSRLWEEILIKQGARVKRIYKVTG